MHMCEGMLNELSVVGCFSGDVSRKTMSRRSGAREANVQSKVRAIPFKLCLKAKLCI